MLIAVGLFSCQENKSADQQKPRIFPEYNQALDEIIKSREGVIRGIDLNSKAFVITKTETKAPSEVAQDYLYFEYTIDSVINYSISYNLQKDSLDEVEVQINCNDLDFMFWPLVLCHIGFLVYCIYFTYDELKHTGGKE